MAFNHAAFFAACRPLFGGKLTQAQVDGLNNALRFGFGTAPAGSPDEDPPWLRKARADIGLKEIPGIRTAPRILQMLSLLRYPFKDDETPWCGTAMAAWMKEAGVEPPAQGFRALNWTTWGIPCPAQVGAVAVKKRDGGGHVFLIVGETADKRFYKGLGANQSNAVNIMDMAKSEIVAVRWPALVPQHNVPLPTMAPGTVSRNEA